MRSDDIAVTGTDDPRLAGFDRMMVEFLREHQTPGAALAIARLGRVVYARGFGWADREARQPVKPDALFRIASVSKPITAVAIGQLWQQGKLSLEDRPFATLPLPAPLPGGQGDPRLRAITILHLLQHRGGWDRALSFDPMFKSVEFAQRCGCMPPAMPLQVIQAMLTQPLDFNPGQRCAYSNFGYCVLGRVIEHVTGLPYDRYVQQCLLAPLGITRARLGRTLPAGRAEGEVAYYTSNGRTGPAVFPPVGREVPGQYGCWCLEAMDAHGGWIASAPDLVRFASALDRPDGQGLLQPATVSAMYARPPFDAPPMDENPPPTWWGCGWKIEDCGEKGLNIFHTGIFDGTNALLLRRYDGVILCVLFNQNTNEQGQSLQELVHMRLHHATEAVQDWPSGEPAEDCR